MNPSIIKMMFVLLVVDPTASCSKEIGAISEKESAAKISAKERKPKILLIGDSIRSNYEPYVRESLQDVAEVVAPGENCQFSAYTLTRLPTWLKELGTPDIVHWNNGLHDLGYNPDRVPKQIPLETYSANIELILKQLKKTGAQIIWATSTPMHPEYPFSEERWSWKYEDVEPYNAAALAIMKKNNIPVNDLHAIVASDIGKYISGDKIHLSEAGKRKCAEAVVNVVKPYLRVRGRGQRGR